MVICSPGQNNEYYDLQFKSNISSEIPLSVDITEDHNRHSFTTFQVTNFEIRLPRELGESTWPYQGGAIGPFAVVVGSLPHHDGLEHSTKWFF